MGHGKRFWQYDDIRSIKNMKNIDYIITAEHYSKREGAGGSVKARILKMRDKHYRKGVVIDIKNLDNPIGAPVRARVEQGAWIADCECGGAEFVSPSEPIFFCWGCANRANKTSVRPVEFPKDTDAIERLLLERPVNDIRGLTDLERVGMALPLAFAEIDGKKLGLSRNWNPDETIADLKKQNNWIKKEGK